MVKLGLSRTRKKACVIKQQIRKGQEGKKLVCQVKGEFLPSVIHTLRSQSANGLHNIQEKMFGPTSENFNSHAMPSTASSGSRSIRT